MPTRYLSLTSLGKLGSGDDETKNPLACLWLFKRASFSKYLPEPGGIINRRNAPQAETGRIIVQLGLVY